MKLVPKITLGLLPVVVGVLSISAYVRVGRQIDQFRRDMRRDQQVLANVLRAAVTEVWRVEGEERALALVANANQAEGSLQLRWVWLDAPPGSESAPDVPAHELVPLPRRNEIVLVRRDAEEGEDRHYTYALAAAPSARTGALEISESLEEERRYVAQSVVTNVGTLLTLAGLGGLILFGLGALVLGRPIRKLVERARQIAAGGLGGRLDLPQRDELGVLARELDLMSERLAEAAARVRTEGDARLRALEQLRHADRLTSVGKLASGIAHELGTPLNVVLGRARMIEAGEVEGVDARRSAAIVAEQVDRMSAIIRQLLDFARPASATKAALDIRGLLRETVALLGPTAKKRGVTLAAEPGVPLVVSADGRLLQQALLNLSLNAVQASPQGSEVRLSARAVEAVPPERGGEAGPHVAVEVEDRGGGIATETLPRIFEPFFTTKDVGEGTGLGLSVSWGIVREHGGWIAVDSTPGEGSRFTVMLPREAK